MAASIDADTVSCDGEKDDREDIAPLAHSATAVSDGFEV